MPKPPVPPPPWVSELVDQLVAAMQAAAKQPEPLWTVKEAAAYLQIPVKEMKNRVTRRSVPFLRIGRSIRFDSAKLRAWANSHTVPTLEELTES